MRAAAHQLTVRRGGARAEAGGLLGPQVARHAPELVRDSLLLSVICLLLSSIEPQHRCLGQSRSPINIFKIDILNVETKLRRSISVSTTE